MSREIKRLQERRQVERRAPKRGVTVRHDDSSGYVPKRVRMVQCGAVIPHPDKQEPSKNWELLSSFVLFCNQHPELTFWNAFSGWVGKDIKNQCPSPCLPKAGPGCIMTSDREYVRAMVRELADYLRACGYRFAAMDMETKFLPRS